MKSLWKVNSMSIDHAPTVLRQIVEISGTLLALSGVLLLLRKNIFYWPVGATANLLWLIHFYLQGNLLAAGLQVAYIIFAAYAFWRWYCQQKSRPFSRWLEYLGNAIIAVALLLALAKTSFSSLNAYLESAAVVLFLTANWLTARKKISCWYFWIAANSIFAIFLWRTGSYAIFASQFVFIALAIWGLRRWKEEDVGRMKSEG